MSDLDRWYELLKEAENAATGLDYKRADTYARIALVLAVIKVQDRLADLAEGA